jgi:hypothetical protein
MGRLFSIISTLILIALLELGCIEIKQSIKWPPSQGLMGQVFEQKGNVMPQKGKSNSKGQGYATIIYVFEPTTMTSVTPLPGGLYTKPVTQLLGTFPTDSTGHFSISLAPGKYSILVGYEGAYFVPFFNQYNELAVVQVLPSLFQSMDVIINVKASF